MPRIANAGPAVDEWCISTGEGSTTHDVCNYCWRNEVDGSVPGEIEALVLYGGAAIGPEPLGTHWEPDVDHPPYEHDEGWIHYRCAVCREDLDDDRDGYTK